MIATHPGELSCAAVAALRSRVKCEAAAARLGAKAYTGPDAAMRAVEENDADICLVAMTGFEAIAPTLAAIRKGMAVALATKEVLVIAGALVMEAAKRAGVDILPVDSEHSAIFQCLGDSFRPLQRGCATAARPSRLILTASGGPFLDGPEDLSSVTPEQALAHPRWKMGPKVTIDSATMMNKGFEIVEASWLFGMPARQIDVVVHPESIVHSLVEFEDGATLAQLSPPDMRVAIQYALTWPGRLKAERARLDLAAAGSLTFRELDEKRFPGPGIMRAACEAGGCAAAVAAAADEWAVEAFLAGRIPFRAIVPLVRECLDRFSAAPCGSLEELAAVYSAVRAHCQSISNKHSSGI